MRTTTIDFGVEHYGSPLPDKFTALRPHQITAIEECVEAFGEVDVVFLDAPTGSGKTLIAEMVRRHLDNGQCDGLYVCTDKSLQDQFVRDFTYARAVKGRANYPTELDPMKTADDCTSMSPGDACWHCTSRDSCPYEIAKRQAGESELAVLNTAYMLAITNIGSSNDEGGTAFNGRGLCIIDEADLTEKLLQGYVGFEVSKRRIYDLSMKPPKERVHKTTLVTWLESFSIRCTEAARMEHDPKKKRSLRRHGQEAAQVARELQMDIDAWGDTRDDDENAVGHWVRDYSGEGAEGLVLKPALVSRYGVRYLWRHQRKFLLMSASLISPDEMAESLGLVVPYRTVVVPSTFPVENRPIIVAPIANVVHAEMDEAIDNLVTGIERILKRHEGERVLVHCVSYKLASELNSKVTAPGFSKYTYGNSRDKEQVLEAFKMGVEHGVGPGHRGKVLFAASMDRGIDLPGDLCTVQIIAKVPYLNLKDRLVSARRSLPGGQLWMTTQMVRSIVQMVGRGVRSETDKCTTYVLDRQFARVLSQSRALLPGWFQDAVVTNADLMWLVRD